MSGIMSGEALRIIPHPDDPKATWYSIADLEQARRSPRRSGSARS